MGGYSILTFSLTSSDCFPRITVRAPFPPKEPQAVKIASIAIVVLASTALASLDRAGSQRNIHQAGDAQIAFVSMRDGIEDIYVMRPDGTDVRRVTVTIPVDGQERGSWVPAWSPDRKRIAFASNRDSGEKANLYVVDADGHNLKRLSDHEGFDYTPDWSPDGSQIVFVSDRDGFYELYSMADDGSGVKRLTHLEKEANRLCCPDWSPDGSKILFMVLEPPMTPVLQLLDLDTGEVTAQGLGGLPRWSPDGEWIAYFSGTDKQVHVRKIDGPESRQVSDVMGFATYPSWSPDGEWIVFNRVPTSGDFDSTEIYLVRPDGSDQRQLTQNHVMDGHASWW